MLTIATVYVMAAAYNSVKTNEKLEIVAKKYSIHLSKRGTVDTHTVDTPGRAISQNKAFLTCFENFK